MPEFVNPKYADASKTKFKKPTRLECMMQEHPKVLPSGAAVGYTQFPDWTYSPVKNSVDEARGKIALGAPGRSAAEGELEYYDAGVRALAASGVPLDRGAYQDFSVFGFALKEPPHIVLHPNFAVSFAGLKSKLPNPSAVKISPRSTLVVEGPDVSIESLDLDGALVIKAVPGARVGECRVPSTTAGCGRNLFGNNLSVCRPWLYPLLICVDHARSLPLVAMRVCSGQAAQGDQRRVGAEAPGGGRDRARLPQDPRLQAGQERRTGVGVRPARRLHRRRAGRGIAVHVGRLRKRVHVRLRAACMLPMARVG